MDAMIERERSIGSVVQDVVGNIGRIVRAEVRLAQIELVDAAHATAEAAKLLGAQRMGLAIHAMNGSVNISHLASENKVSRKFVYQQKNLALEAINDAFAPTAADDEVLFYLPVTKAWLRQGFCCISGFEPKRVAGLGW